MSNAQKLWVWQGVVGRPFSSTTPVGFNTAAQLCCLWCAFLIINCCYPPLKILITNHKWNSDRQETSKNEYLCHQINQPIRDNKSVVTALIRLNLNWFQVAARKSITTSQADKLAASHSEPAAGGDTGGRVGGGREGSWRSNTPVSSCTGYCCLSWSGVNS